MADLHNQGGTFSQVKKVGLGAALGGAAGIAASFLWPATVITRSMAPVAGGAGFGLGLWGFASPIANVLGFTTSGIASSSIAASWMSASAITNGGGVASGGFVAFLQSVGVVGLAPSWGLGLLGTGTAVGLVLRWLGVGSTRVIATTPSTVLTKMVEGMITGGAIGAMSNTCTRTSNVNP